VAPPTAPPAPQTSGLATSTDTSAKLKNTRATAGIVVGVLVGLAILSYVGFRYVKKRTAEKYELLAEAKQHSTELTSVGARE